MADSEVDSLQPQHYTAYGNTETSYLNPNASQHPQYATLSQGVSQFQNLAAGYAQQANGYLYRGNNPYGTDSGNMPYDPSAFQDYQNMIGMQGGGMPAYAYPPRGEPYQPMVGMPMNIPAASSFYSGMVGYQGPNYIDPYGMLNPTASIGESPQGEKYTARRKEKKFCGLC